MPRLPKIPPKHAVIGVGALTILSLLGYGYSVASPGVKTAMEIGVPTITVAGTVYALYKFGHNVAGRTAIFSALLIIVCIVGIVLILINECKSKWSGIGPLLGVIVGLIAIITYNNYTAHNIHDACTKQKKNYVPCNTLI